MDVTDLDAFVIKTGKRLDALEGGRPAPAPAVPTGQDISDLRAFMTRAEPLLSRVEAMLEDYEAYKAETMRTPQKEEPKASFDQPGAPASAEPVGLRPDAGVTGSTTGPLGGGDPNVRDGTGELFSGTGVPVAQIPAPGGATTMSREPDEAYCARLTTAASTDQERSEIMLATGGELDQIGARYGIARYG